MDSHDKVDNVSMLVWNVKSDLSSCNFLIHFLFCVLFMFPFSPLPLRHLPAYAGIVANQQRRHIH
jgi:hypothetical protein